MSVITKFETWVCRRPQAPGTLSDEGAGRRVQHGDTYVVLRLTTDDGYEGIATALAAYTAQISLAYLNEIIAPVVLGRDPHDREAIWQDLYDLNRRLVFFPVWLPGPVDVALWDIAAKQAGLPLYKYLGAYRDSLPVYASSQFLGSVEDYLVEARSYQAIGVTAYKAHPSGAWREHIEISTALREAFPDLTLMLDPAGSNYSLPEAITVGRALERLDFYFLEEPFYDQFLGKYVELCRTLDIPIAATETTGGGPAGVAEFIRAGAADIVRADPSWKWGITGTMKILHLAEAFGINCEIHTTMGGLDIVNVHISCAVRNCAYFELFAPHDGWHFPFRESLILDGHGHVHAPKGPGLGATIDWDAVDDSTLTALKQDSRAG